MPATSDELAQFTAHIARCPIFEAALGAIALHNIPNCFVSGTGVAQTYWNVAHRRSYLDNLSDLDIVYFDAADLDPAREQDFERKLAAQLRDFSLPVDVKNQARVHLWYAGKHGYAIPPYESIEHAIGTFPTTAGAVCLRQAAPSPRAVRVDVYAPFGLTDVLALKVRPNKAVITQAFYERKAKSYKERWPMLEILPW